MLHLLDTNVVSELMRPRPDRRVLDRAAAQPLTDLVVAPIVVIESRFGIATLSQGRRTDLDGRLNQLLAQAFAGRVLPFDYGCADAHADIRVSRQRAGRPIATEDAMIAAVARVHGAAVVTRDAGSFAGCGLVLVVDPWAP